MAVETVTLTDASTGTTARILPGLGFNVYQFQVLDQGQPREVLWSAPGFENGQQRASGSGIPLLFPFPGRLRGRRLVWEGKEYGLPEGDGRGNAIHGFVLDRPWRVTEQSESHVVGQFQASVDDPALLDCWPADFQITATYQVQGNALRANYRLENPDSRPLPCGFGTHPYFRLPLGSGRAEDCLVRLPVTEQWELADMLPTGKRLPLDDPQQFQSGLKFGEMTFDNVLAGLQWDKGQCRTRIQDPHSGRQMVMTFDRVFRECVVYTPPHREAVCIEPYTCLPGGFPLDPPVDHGLRVLGPSQDFQGNVEIRVE